MDKSFVLFGDATNLRYWMRTAATGKSKSPEEEELKPHLRFITDYFSLFQSQLDLKTHWAHFQVQWTSFCVVYLQFAFVFLDDIVIFSKCLQAHIKHVIQVLTPPCDACVAFELKLNQLPGTGYSPWTTRNFTAHRTSDSWLEVPNQLYRTTIHPGLVQRLSKFCTQLGTHCCTAGEKMAKQSTNSLHEACWRGTTRPTNIIT